MKKYISVIAIALLGLAGFNSCDTETKEEPGGTAIEKMCGYWDVMISAVDENGEVVYDDPYGAGVCDFYTYNTNDNGTTQMWLDDRNTFWAYKFLVNIDYDKRTFWCDSTEYDAAGTGIAVVTDGKILEGAARNSHGMPNDSISFYIWFDDDSYAGAYYDRLWVHGQRHTGFSSDTE